MWLLDKNVPEQVISVLRSFSIALDTAKNRGWGELRNGELLAAASAAKFNCILTRDTLFQEDARKTLEKHPHMALILLTIPQMPGKKICRDFSCSLEKGSHCSDPPTGSGLAFLDSVSRLNVIGYPVPWLLGH